MAIIEYRIMGVPERREKYILPMLSRLGLPEDIVSYDYKKTGNAMENAKRTWLKETDADFVCVFQDDLLLAHNIKSIINECAEHFPKAVFSFYNPRIHPEERTNETPYVRVVGYGLYGPALLIPTYMIKPIFYWGDVVYGRDFPHDDTVIGFFCKTHNVDVMTTNPSIVQHLGHNDSMLGYNNKNKVSKVFEENVVVDIFKTSKCVNSKYIPNTEIKPQGGYPCGQLKRLSEI